tara:strand:- start:2630 stop:3370 length:741 start_codon:yes stop_codon:yes gene_type:complete
MKFNKAKFINDGFLVQKKIISDSYIKKFFKEIKHIVEIYKEKNFETLFNETKERNLIYKKLQNLNSVRSIVHKVCNKFEKHKIYKKLGFKVPFITNGLILSLPKENDNLNPLHQDIYNFYSYNFIKIWLPLTQVSNKNGSMLAYKSSNSLGFIEPKYKNNNSTYPEIEKKFTKGFKEVIFNLNPGDCVIFDPFLLHKSVKNSSKFTRFNIGIDIQDFDIKGDPKIINKMISIKKERSERRQLKKNK